MYAKTGVKTTVATSRTGALHWRADAGEKIKDPDFGACRGIVTADVLVKGLSCGAMATRLA